MSRCHGLTNTTQYAAGNFLAPAEELSVNGFRTVMEIDAIGSFNMSRAAFPLLAAAQDSRIINISATLHYGATWYQVCACAFIDLCIVLLQHENMCDSSHHIITT